MPRKIFFLLKLLLFISTIMGKLSAAEISIIPLKKPILDKETQRAKISQGIIQPKSKPSKKVEKPKTILVKKEVKKINFLIPKSKPLIVKKAKSVVSAKSKYYSQKDFGIAKKSLQLMQKSQWSAALKQSKKLKTNLYIILFNGVIY